MIYCATHEIYIFSLHPMKYSKIPILRPPLRLSKKWSLRPLIGQSPRWSLISCTLGVENKEKNSLNFQK